MNFALGSSPKHRYPRRETVAVILAVATLAALAPTSSAGDKPLDAKLVQLDGGKLKLEDLRGQPVLLELWATWCLPCRQQSEILGDLVDEIEALGVKAFAVDQGEDAEKVRKYQQAKPSPFPVLLDRYQTISAELAIGELPALVLLDADGFVVETFLGLAKREDILRMLARGGGEADAPPSDPEP